jgi:hypothetical protein
MRNLLLALLQRGLNLHVDPGPSKVCHQPVATDRLQQTIAMAVRQGLRATHFTPEKYLGDQAAESSSAKRLNACWPDASTHKSRGRDGEKAAMTRYGSLTNYYLGIVYSFRDSITAGWVIFPPRTFRPLAKPGSAASAASTPRLASA